MILHTKLGKSGYDIVIQKGVRHCANRYWNLSRKVLIVTDSGVPFEYAQSIANLSKEAFIKTVPMGESSKSMAMLEEILLFLLQHHFTRTDCIVAVGGGVVGDLAGFAAATYLRGIDFYNLPTTLLSQVDSSVGGKVAVNLCGVKNSVGAFYQPKGVLIDAETLETLSPRQLSCGYAEAIKMGMTSDKELFSMFESGTESIRIEEVIERSLRVKISVVEKDETEQNLRKVLNFGHTLGHALEAAEDLHGLFHGECVALGMLPMCSNEVRERLLPILNRLHLPTENPISADELKEYIYNDKKCDGDNISTVFVKKVGSYEINKEPIERFCNRIFANHILEKGDSK